MSAGPAAVAAVLAAVVAAAVAAVEAVVAAVVAAVRTAAGAAGAFAAGAAALSTRALLLAAGATAEPGGGARELLGRSRGSGKTCRSPAGAQGAAGLLLELAGSAVDCCKFCISL